MSIADKLITIAENVQKTYDAGYEKGKSEGGYDEGYEIGHIEGKQAEYDRFWDAYQDYGNRAAYKNAFNNSGWTNETFKPKYDLIITSNSYNMFDDSHISGSLSEILANLGIKLEFTYISYQSGGFINTQFTEINYIVKNCEPTLSAVFRDSSQLHTLKVGTVTPRMKFSNAFNNLPSLENLTIEGEIGQNGFDVSSSPLLSKTSIENVIGCLSNDTSDLAVSFSITAVNKAFETAEGLNDGSTSAEWTTLANTKSNWTITLM